MLIQNRLEEPGQISESLIRTDLLKVSLRQSHLILLVVLIWPVEYLILPVPYTFVNEVWQSGTTLLLLDSYGVSPQRAVFITVCQARFYFDIGLFSCGEATYLGETSSFLNCLLQPSSSFDNISDESEDIKEVGLS